MSEVEPAPGRLSGLGRRSDTASRASDAARHQRRVRRLRITIPAIAILCVAAVFVSLIMNSREDIRLVEGDAPGIEMAAPNLKGIDSNGRPYEVQATQATQSREGLVQLNDVSVRMELEDGQLTLTARTGQIHPDTGIASVEGDVRIDLGGVNHVRTERADADLKAGRVTGDRPVRVDGPMGTIDAQGFVIEKSVQQITFTGGIRSTVYPDKSAQGTSPQ